MSYRSLLLSAATASFLHAGFAASVHADATGAVADRDVLIVTGTRAEDTPAGDSIAPVDVISANDLGAHATGDLSTILRSELPGYNVNTQPILDAATLIRPANLRGLSPDHTLVLIDGKRLHRAAVITFLGNGVSDGAQGPDISALPAIAFERVEVLRDGASSQYGSDAIAGVINFIPRESREGVELDLRGGQTYAGDGEFYRVSGHAGLPLGPDGFLALSAEFSETGATDRSIQRDDAAALIAAGNSAVADPAQVWGQPETDDHWKLFANAALTLSRQVELYGFAHAAARTTEGGFYFRNPISQGGIFEGPLVDPVTALADAGGIPSILVGSLNGASCPAGIPLTAGGGLLPDAAILSAVTANPDCFSFYELFPGGFTPRFGGDLTDSGIALGVRGDLGDLAGLRYDISLNWGRNEIDFFLNNSVNASLGPQSPTSFRPGGYGQEETLARLDVALPVEVNGLASPLTLGAGYEYREEAFTISAGDAASYAQGALASQGFAGNASGFAGFSPRIAGTSRQSSHALYLDAEADITPSLTVQAGVRWEDYDAFGDTTSFKLGGIYQPTEDWRVHGTLSSGFHAPTAGQANVINITTALTQAGDLEEEGTFPLASPAGQIIADYVAGDIAEGGLGDTRPALGREKAQNWTLGTSFTVADVDMRVDYYQIELKDRLARSSRLDFQEALRFLGTQNGLTLQGATTRALIDELVQGGALAADTLTGFGDVTRFSFFGNAFDTRTRGVDLRAARDLRLTLEGTSRVELAVTYNETEVTRAGSAIDEGRIANMEGSLPNWKGHLTATHQQGRYDGLFRVNYYGEYFEDHLGAFPFLPINGDAQWTLDLELGANLNDHARLSLGAANLLNSYPSENPWGFIVGPKYPPTAPAGFEGGTWYAGLNLRF